MSQKAHLKIHGTKLACLGAWPIAGLAVIGTLLGCGGVADDFDASQESTPELTTMTPSVPIPPPAPAYGSLASDSSVGTLGPSMTRPDILAHSMKIYVRHSSKQICVAAMLKNIGNAYLKGPFRVAIGISSYSSPPPNQYIQKIVDVPSSVVVAPNGFYETGCATARLLYREDDAYATYDFEYIADVDHTVPERSESNNNNYNHGWYAHRP